MQGEKTAIELAKQGITGVAIALVVLVGFTVYLLWKLTTNHIFHANAYVQENTKVQQKLSDTNDKVAGAVDKLSDTISRMKR